jgi:hypothetical protein
MPRKYVACFRKKIRATQLRPSHFSAFLDSPIRGAARGIKCKCGIKMRSSSNKLSSLSLPIIKLSHAFSDNLSSRSLSNFSQSFSDCLSLRQAFSVLISVDVVLSVELTLFDAHVGLKRFWDRVTGIWRSGGGVRGALWEETVLGEGAGRSVLDGERTSSGMKKEDEGNVRDSQTEVRKVEISSWVAGLTRRKSAFEKDG